MKALIVSLLVSLLSTAAMADTFKYRLFYDEEKTDALDITIEIELSGKFEKGSKVESMKIWGEKRNKMPVLLFNIPADELTAKWTAENVLDLSSKMNHESVVTKEYIAIHSDTNINPNEEYSFDSIKISEEGTLEGDSEGFFLGNQTVEEMALNGYMKKI